MPDLTYTAPATAVLVVDMQNDNLHPDGAFAGSGAAAHAAEQNVVENVAAVLAAARAAGASVVHNRIVASPAGPAAGPTHPSSR